MNSSYHKELAAIDAAVMKRTLRLRELYKKKMKLECKTKLIRIK